MQQFLQNTATFISKLGPVNTFIDALASRIVPETTALASSCFVPSISCGIRCDRMTLKLYTCYWDHCRHESAGCDFEGCYC